MDREDIVLLFRDYRWMLKQLEILWNTQIDNRTGFRDKLVATYGIESVMPRGSGRISFAELEELDRREARHFLKIDMFSKKIEFVESTEQLFINDLKLFTVRECMLEKNSEREIAEIIDCSVSTAKRLRNKVIETILFTDDVNVLNKMNDLNKKDHYLNSR